MPQANNQTVSPIKIVANKIVKPTDKNNETKTKKCSIINSPPQSPTTRNINKSKKFVTPNRYSIIAQDESEPVIADNTDTLESLDHQNPAQINTTNDAPKEISPPPIFIKGSASQKIKIEEPHKKRQIPQCQNCQSYGHTRTYCAHNYTTQSASNVETITPTSSYVKSPDLPAKCALCEEAHPANTEGALSTNNYL
ncbi:Uncharacterized protein FWK35_00034176, partial [Aphis craccivora]